MLVGNTIIATTTTVKILPTATTTKTTTTITTATATTITITAAAAVAISYKALKDPFVIHLPAFPALCLFKSPKSENCNSVWQ